MPLTLSELILARLEQLGGKTPYWLGEQIGYEPRNMYNIVNGRRGLPEEYFPRLMRALGWDEGTAEGKALRHAVDLARAGLKKDTAPTVEALQRDLHRLEQELQRSHGLLARQRTQIAALREQRESAASQISELSAKLTEAINQYTGAHLEVRELKQLVARLSDLMKQFQPGSGKSL